MGLENEKKKWKRRRYGIMNFNKELNWTKEKKEIAIIQNIVV